jgi:hypothetical protein
MHAGRIHALAHLLLILLVLLEFSVLNQLPAPQRTVSISTLPASAVRPTSKAPLLLRLLALLCSLQHPTADSFQLLCAAAAVMIETWECHDLPQRLNTHCHL